MAGIIAILSPKLKGNFGFCPKDLHLSQNPELSGRSTALFSRIIMQMPTVTC